MNNHIINLLLELNLAFELMDNFPLVFAKGIFEDVFGMINNVQASTDLYSRWFPKASLLRKIFAPREGVIRSIHYVALFLHTAMAISTSNKNG